MYFGEVAERSIAAGCKPAAFGLRRFEPSPPLFILRQAALRAAVSVEVTGLARGRAARAGKRSAKRSTRACLAEAARGEASAAKAGVTQW